MPLKIKVIFFMVNLGLATFYLDSWKNPNTTSRVLQVRALHEHSTLNIDKYREETIDISYVNGHYYPDKAPLPVFVVFPVYSVLVYCNILPDSRTDNGFSIFLLGSFFSSLCLTLIIFLIFNHLIKSGRSLKDAFLLSSLPVYGSMLFVYSGTFYSHIPVAFLLLLSFILLRGDRFYFFAGFCAGAAFLSEYLVALFGAVWFFQILYLKSWKQASLFGLGIFPFIAMFMWYNFQTTGTLLKTLYSYQTHYDMSGGGFTLPQLSAAVFMLFSPWRGLLIYVPVLWTFIRYINYFRKPMKLLLFENYAILASMLFFIAVSSHKEWTGGWTFGPRYLIPMLGIWLYTGLGKISLKGKLKWWFYLPVALGITYSFVAKFTVIYSIPSKYYFPFIRYIYPKLREGSFNEGNILSMLYYIDPMISALCFSQIFLLISISVLIFTGNKSYRSIKLLS